MNDRSISRTGRRFGAGPVVILLIALAWAMWWMLDGDGGHAPAHSQPIPNVAPDSHDEPDSSSLSDVVAQQEPRVPMPVDHDPSKEGATTQGVQQEVVLVLEFHGELAVAAISYPEIRWPDALFRLQPVSPWSVWVDLRSTATVEPSGRFVVRTECRRMPQSQSDSDELVLQSIRDWTHMKLEVLHPLLRAMSTEVALTPWPEELAAGPATPRVIHVGVLSLPLATGVLGRVTRESARAAAGAVVGLYPLSAEGEIELSIESLSAVADEEGHFFLHFDQLASALVVATLEGLSPAAKKLEIKDGTVLDLGILELQEGARISGRIDLPESARDGAAAWTVLLDGVDPPLRATKQVRHQSLGLSPLQEYFTWDGVEVRRLRTRTTAGPDGSFLVGGLPSLCFRLRAVAPQVGSHPVNSVMVERRTDVWGKACAPSSGVVLTAGTSVIHTRVVRTHSDHPALPTNLPGMLTWIDEAGNVQTQQCGSLDGPSFEAVPGQKFELRVHSDPSGLVHHLTAPPAGTSRLYEIEVPQRK